MQDDFDDGGTGLPEDDMAGGTDLGDLDAGAEGEIDLDMETGGPAGRPRGGARARSSSSGRSPAGAPRKRAAASRAAAGRKKSGGKKKAARKGKKRAARKGKKAAGRKGARKASARGRKSGRARKAGKKK